MKNQLAVDIKNNYKKLANELMYLYLQFYQELAAEALHELGWGYKRIVRFCDLQKDYFEHQVLALSTDYSEADLLREQIDNNLRDIWKGRPGFQTFDERYPELAIDYRNTKFKDYKAQKPHKTGKKKKRK